MEVKEIWDWIKDNSMIVGWFVGPVIAGIISLIGYGYKKGFEHLYIKKGYILDFILPVLISTIMCLITVSFNIYLLTFMFVRNTSDIDESVILALYIFTVASPILFLIGRINNFNNLINEFYLYRFTNNFEYKFFLSNYKKIAKENYRVANSDFYKKGENLTKLIEIINLKESFYVNKDTYMFNDAFINLYRVERSNVIKSWFIINKIKGSIFGILPSTFYALFFLIWYLWFQNSYYYIQIALFIINFVPLIIQQYITNNILKENYKVKTEFIKSVNQKRISPNYFFGGNY